ncbi:MAG: hypothetical protein KGH79_03515 [Patescibacteria group bacterium]|nr:hypothetical protein [Patescibacteria group bacterium]
MKRLFIALVIIGIVGYGLFEARKLIEGPVITIDMPKNGSATSTTGVIIAGEAENISFLSINDKPSHTDEQGHFSELLSLPPGVTVLTVAATDRFGRRAVKSVSINVLNYCPNA